MTTWLNSKEISPIYRISKTTIKFSQSDSISLAINHEIHNKNYHTVRQRVQPCKTQVPTKDVCRCKIKGSQKLGSLSLVRNISSMQACDN